MSNYIYYYSILLVSNNLYFDVYEPFTLVKLLVAYQPYT
jgi:hypothetical protein